NSIWYNLNICIC
ncbi:hypothetical protein EC950183_4919, partial [Escherichia coli 95.0183]